MKDNIISSLKTSRCWLPIIASLYRITYTIALLVHVTYYYKSPANICVSLTYRNNKVLLLVSYITRNHYLYIYIEIPLSTNVNTIVYTSKISLSITVTNICNLLPLKLNSW